jgi:hypothetical protein
MGATKRNNTLNCPQPVRNKIPAPHRPVYHSKERTNRSTSQNLQAQNFSRFALRYHFERAAAHFTVRCEALAGHACVHDDLKSLSAKWALDFFGNFHATMLPAAGSFATPRPFWDLPFAQNSEILFFRFYG